ncbi:S1C family serine protease [Streptomyces subrutilus]|uniref:Serine protease n=1 Tax=Streptomyces subrutilus TaxID=36818 RepID=A0A1E5PTY2_9ACTN|nr:trypsin-like peptidase domain-containing protein [Streptomyces subrutilus]OEJ32999.1 serine protease [Streptomyces subrutilus]
MTESFRREGEYPQEHRPTPAGAAYPPPPSYPPAAPGWHEAHEPPVIRGETVPAVVPVVPVVPEPAPPVRHRAKKPVSLIAAVALAAAVVGGGTAAAVQQLMGGPAGGGAGGAGGVNGTNVSQSYTGTVSGVAEQNSPSVVRIDTRTGSGQGTGSGIVLTADGEIATNNHVISGASEIQVTTSDGKKYPAKIVGTDPDKDLALIKLQGAGGLRPAKLGDSGSLKVGEQVVAIGSPDRLTGTVTSGIVSALEREVNVAKPQAQSPRQQGDGGWPFSYGGQEFNGNTGSDTASYKAIQTDASLNPGNSGGALFNMNGEIVGMPSAIYSPGSGGDAGSVGLGFAIPVDTIKADLDSLRKGGPGGAGSSGTGGGNSTANGFGTSY